jgi:hypothetical protein
MKVVIASSKELLVGICFAAIVIIGLQFFMAINSLDYCPKTIQTKAKFWKNQLAEGTYIVNSVKKDSLQQWQINSYIQFEGNNSYDEAHQIKKVNLYDPRYKNLPLVYASYYLLLGLLWSAVFYHFIKYLNRIKQSQTFEKENLKHLYLSGRFISIISFVYFFSLTGFSIIHHYLFQIQIPYNSLNSYHQFILLFVFNLLHLILRSYAKSTFSGMEMKTEQELTV